MWSLAFACLGMFALGIGDNIRGPLFPELINFFSLTNSQGSMSFALASAAAGVGTVLSAYILRKIQLDKLLMFSMLLMMLGLFQMGGASNFSLYMLGAAIFGFSLGTTGVSQNLLIAENMPIEQQTKALSGLHGLYGLSSLIAPYVASRAPEWFQEKGVQVQLLTDWRSAFFVTGLVAFLVLIGILVIRAEPHFRHTHLEPHEKKIKMNTLTLAIISVFFSSYVGAEILISTRLALYMRTYFGMNLEQSSNYVIYFFIFLLAGRFLFALKSLKYPLKWQLSASLVLSLLSLVLGMWVHPIFLAVVGLTMAPFYPLAVAYIAQITGVHKRKYLTFVMSMQSLLVVCMHIGVGYLTDSFGLFYAFGVGLILLVLSLLCLNLHPQVEL